MRSVLFRFRSEVPFGIQDTILSSISSWPSIVNVGRLYPNAKYQDRARTCFVYLQQGANVNDAIRLLSDVPEIETAFLPAERKLM